ncbi:DUF624 domain-containing protein [Marinilactibacillus psychrotolerans]|uniref:DUF624 domain-containing protein n=1 Tax=Marinilactibacillus psychrotolerans TaxID=191770 RepID=A0A5R9C3A5_9LACT|nr:YesL family protein [Marinilactibacillus psychrotolerans]TLQ07272.1 DUF624 domain-containing protein [Marinilactibacillus psychrotolerans]
MWKHKAYSVAYELSDKISKLFIANLLWIILNSPLLIVAIQLRTVTQPSSYYVLLPLLSLGLPLFFFPSTQALFCLVRDVVLQTPVSTVKTFWRYWVSNFKESLKMGILLSGLFTGIGLLLYYSWSVSFILFTIALIALLFILIIMVQLFCFQAHFEMPFIWKSKRAQQLVFARIFYSVGSFMIVLFMIYASFEMSIAVFVWMTPVACVYTSFILFNYQYNKIISNKKVQWNRDSESM